MAVRRGHAQKEAVFSSSGVRLGVDFKHRGSGGQDLASAVRVVHLGVGWADEAVGVRVERFWIILFLLKREVPTHQTAVGPLAGHACLTTGSESSPLLA